MTAEAGSADEPERVEDDEPERIQPDEPTPLVIKRRGRRVATEPTPGYTGEPARERQQSNENDEQLRRDVPPHWG